MKNRNLKKTSTLGGFLFSIVYLTRAIYWDLSLRFRNLINPEKAYEYYKKDFEHKCTAGCRMLSFFSGLKFDIELKNNLPENFIIISNHQSLADIIIIGYAFKEYNVKFVAKKSLKYNAPLISIYLRTGKHAFVGQRDNFKTTIKEFEKLAALAESNKVCPVIFPEGTRSRDGKLGVFHSAALKLICRFTDLPIVSVALDGGFNFSNIYGFINASSKITYRLKVLNVYSSPEDKAGVNTLIDKIRTEIDLQLSKWRN
jgi:1-acyl-sn-glycerol-3-phosphate acyltransferase